MSVDAVATLLQAVAQTLKVDPRNEYEASVRYMNNIERLAQAEQGLVGFSGAYPDALRGELASLVKQVEAHKTLSKPDAAGLFNLDFVDDGAIREEVDAAERELRAEEMKRKGKKGSKKSAKKDARKLAHEDDQQSVDSGPAVPTPASASPAPPCGDSGETVIPTWLPGETMHERARYTACSFHDIPSATLGKAECRLIPNTPLAALLFRDAAEFDGDLCRFVVELPRLVVLVLAKGAMRDVPPVVVPTTDPMEANEGGDSSTATSAENSDEEGEEGDAVARNRQPVEMGNHSNLSALSGQLVSEFQAAEEEAEAEDSLAGFPRELSAKATAPLRTVTDAVWVVLMCHGGYFAGGVFQAGQSVVHKSFQRYVVRKKQGGRQSTNAKDGGGSYNSIGSQIRAAQEVKWRLDVRSLLYAWRPFIDAASFILYVAPGPQNRSVLSDFTVLPPSTVHGETGPSPVSFKDPRVHKAPLTTHRPSFAEVQRVFTAVSRCNVVYASASRDDRTA